MKKIFNKEILLILVLIVISRLPQLLSPLLYLDGDEAIVGLMAKHLLEGKEISLYFWGQTYGFSLIETSIIAFNYSIFGISDYAVKISMLILWTIGVIFLYKTLIQLNPKKKWLALLLIIAFIITPAWAVWSMKARGGYLTSFMLSSIATYILVNQRIRKRNFVWCLLCLIMVLIFESQALWLAGLLPIFIYYLWKEKKSSRFWMSLTVIVVLSVIFYIIKKNMSDFWHPGFLSFNNIWTHFIRLPKHIYQNISGNYYLGDIYNAPVFTKILSIAVVCGIFTSLITQVVFIIKKKINPISIILTISVLLILSYTLVLKTYTPRYLLPLSASAFLMFFMMLNDIPKKTTILILAAFIGFGSVSLYEFKNYEFTTYKKMGISDEKQIDILITYLKDNYIKYTYCRNPLLQWQLNFYSKEEILSRYDSPNDRNPEYAQKVDNALNSKDEHIALFGFYPYEEDKFLIKVGEKYFVILDPTKEQLQSWGFGF
ncbi:MAG: hypothetical protein K9J13_09080 [Saprospiraceae bacterium]|nr:hypothetical protein [Saprospiraceae bacterium]